MKKERRKLKRSKEDKILYAVLYVIVGLILVVTIYPLVFVVSSSFSSGTAVTSGKVILWPVDFSLTGYRIVFNYRSVWVGYGNTLFYTVVGTVMNLVLTILAAYPLSRRDFGGRGFYMTLFMIIMFFSGGIIPKYILMSDLGLVNTRWAIVLDSAISVSNLIIMRTYFMNSIPGDLLEAARVDGISDIGYLFHFILPLSKPIIAVITMYYAVGHWNSYFSAMMYLRDSNLKPLQMTLRDILKISTINAAEVQDAETIAAMTGAADVMKYALIVVAAVPILLFYPFIQKYFEKGVMIGSVKG